jgi:cytidylate kinase
VKVIVSSWPACGATTLSMILSKNLNLRLYKGSETFRFFHTELEKTGISTDFEKTSEELIQPYWAPIYDDYLRDQFDDQNVDNVIVDSDLTGFLVKNRQNIFSTFLYASDEARQKHFMQDKRAGIEESFKKRDEKLDRTYRNLHSIEFFNIEYIKNYYDLPLDISEVKIAPELVIVYEGMFKKGLLTHDKLKILSENSVSDEKEYLELGKDNFKSILKEKGLIISGQELIKEIAEKRADDVNKLPEHLRKIVGSLL